MNIYQKLLELKKAVPYLRKADKAFDYDFVSEDDTLAVINPKMIELGLILLPSITPGTAKWARHDYVTSKGKPVTDILVTADMVYTWIDVETGERIEASWTMLGQQDDASQALGSGVTYCGRYYLLKALQIATGADDPDKWRAEQKRLQAKTSGKPAPAPTSNPPDRAGAPTASAEPQGVPGTPAENQTPPVETWSEEAIRDYTFHGISDGKGGHMDYPAAKAIALGPKGAAWLKIMSENQKRSMTDREVAKRALALCEGA